MPTSPEVRDALRNRFGAGPYKAFFSIVSLIGFAIIVLGYHKMQLNPGKNPVLWDPPTRTRHIALLLMLPAMIFLVASQIPSRIRTAVKHPLLIAIKTWALAHLLANGDVASLLLFGAFLAFAVYDRISLKKRGDVGALDAAKPTSPINDVIVVGVGLALYAALLYGGHQWLIGVAPLPSLAG
ncbi:MAG TPA: NnrU family protein [Hyphomicrobium sp.]|nr:NnrU family protein [Hyphomicrobium sp.]